MPINTPPDWLPGVLASADLNDHVRDAVRWLAGFSDGPKGMVTLSSSVPVALTTSPGWTTLSFDTADGNVAETGDELWDAGVPELITWPYDCWALFSGGMRTEPTTANKALRTILNGDDSLPLSQHDNIGVSTPAFTTISLGARLYLFSAGDTIELQGFQDAGVSINAIVEGKASPHFWAAWFAVNDD